MRDSTVVYCGVPGSFSHTVAVRHFGKDNIFMGTLRVADVFSVMERGEAHYGVIPLENNWEGPIREHFDLVEAHRVFLIGDEYVNAVHHLMGVRVKSKTIEERIRGIRKVVSHPRSLNQCSTFFEEHPYMDPTVFSDTGRAAQYVADLGDPSVAAIASIEAAKVYNLEILMENVHSATVNMTRYGFLSTAREHITDPNKGSIIAILPHQPGQLFRLLEILARDQYNLTWIEQRPRPGTLDEFIVFLDFEFPERLQVDYAQTLADLRTVAKDLRELGVYRSLRENLVQ